MPKLLLNLRHVPADEADEVRALMADHRIDCYETPPSAFLISAGGIWVRDETEYPRAKALLDEYQVERARRARREYERASREGRTPTAWGLVKREPVKILFYLGLSVGILVFMFTLVVQLGSGS